MVLILQAEFCHSLGDELVGDAVAAAGAVVGLVLEVALALEGIVKDGGL